MAVEYDMELLKILDALPTFSPLIVELALERNNMTIPNTYLDLTPELRVKLRAQLKGRIRPLIVVAYDKSSVSVEKAVEDMTGKLFSLHNVREILPLVQALRLPPENAIEFLSSWIGITYFEYEYSMIQNHLKQFAVWLSKSSYLNEHISVREKDYADALVRQIKDRLSIDWKRIYALSNAYRETYSDLVYNGEIAKFSKFLLKCKQAYWERGDLLGRFEQTAIAWRVFNASYHGKRILFSILINFFVLLRKLHDAPPQVNSSDIDERPAEGGGLPALRTELVLSTCARAGAYRSARNAPNGGTARYSPSPRLELVASFGKKFVHLLAQILPRQGDTMALEIAEKFAEHVFIAGLVQIGTDDLLGISLCFSAADVHQFCRPKPEQLVAPSGHTEVLFVSVTVVFFVQLAL